MSFEGLRHEAARLPDGRWTVGYGHTLSARAGVRVTEADARDLLLYDLIHVGREVGALVFTPLNQNQFDALVCFAFNIGLENFRQSLVLRWVNEGALLDAAFAIEQWRKADLDGDAIVVDGLVRRRAAEKVLFLTPHEGWPVVPSHLVQPRPDQNFDGHAPSQRPVEIRADLTGDVARAVRVRDIPLALDPHPDPARIFPPEDETLAPFPQDLTIGPEVESAPIMVPAPVSEPVPVDPPVPPPAAPVEPPLAPPGTEAARPEPVAPPPTARPGARPVMRDFEFATVEPEEGGYGGLIALGVVGLILFAVCLFWVLTVHGAAGPFSPAVFGGLGALIGVACVVAAVYLVIHRFLGRED